MFTEIVFLIYIITNSIVIGQSSECQQTDAGGAISTFQSPINIDERNTRKISLPPLRISNLDSPSAVIEIKNTGYYYEALFNQEATLTGGPLTQTYTFKNFHLHWGKTDNEGSEHQINNKRYSMEGHFVFSRTYNYSVSLSELENARVKYYTKKCEQSKGYISNDITRTGLMETIINSIMGMVEGESVEEDTMRRNEYLAAEKAVFQYITYLENNSGPNDDPCQKINMKDDKAKRFSVQPVTINSVIGVLFLANRRAPRYAFLEYTSRVQNVNATAIADGNVLTPILSLMNFNNYFTYPGSLTTPPFSSNVNWIVLRDPLQVTSEQLAGLRQLQATDGGMINQNWREIQRLDGRQVYYRKS